MEKQLLGKMMNEYEAMLSKYCEKVDSLEIMDIKKIIYEVKLFWYRHRKTVEYWLNHITKEDGVAFLAGAVRLDIENNGHYEFCMVGKTRIINDPFYKMEAFFSAEERLPDINYFSKYMKDTLSDILLLLKDYKTDFCVLPIEVIIESQSKEYYKTLASVSEKLFFAMFKEEYRTTECYFEHNQTYEDIESNLSEYVSGQLIFDSLTDKRLSIRDKCKAYLENNSEITIYEGMNEAEIFFALTIQHWMQLLAILMIMKSYKMVPFIRDDVTYQFFLILLSSNLMEDYAEEDFLNIHIPFVLQKYMDFEAMDYQNFRECFGNGKLVEYIRQRNVRKPDEIISVANEYIEKIVSFS